MTAFEPNQWSFVHINQVHHTDKAALREIIALQTEEYLARGGRITHCSSSDNRAAQEVSRLTREESLAVRKRLDTITIEAAAARKRHNKPTKGR